MKTIEDLTELVKRYKAGDVTEANMQAQIARFAAAVRREALEEALAACLARPGGNEFSCAAAIRSLQSPPFPEGTA